MLLGGPWTCRSTAAISTAPGWSSSIPRPSARARPGSAWSTFGLSANNVTYAVISDMLGCWDFFPAELGRSVRIADVVESSRTRGLPVGRRCFGYLPMSEELVVHVGRVDDERVHRRLRQAVASAYSRYSFVDPAGAGTADEDHRMLLPLYFTAFLVDDFLGDHDRRSAPRCW